MTTVALTKTALALSVVGLTLVGVGIGVGADRVVFPPHDSRDAMETIAKLDDWRLTCAPRTQKDGGCIIQSGIVQKGTTNMVAELSIAKKDKGDLLSILVPLGVYVPSGVQLTIGNGGAKTVPFKTCLDIGCIATVPFDPDLSQAMSQNPNGLLTVVAGNGKALPLSFSLRGYNNAMSERAVDTAHRSKS